MWLLLLSLLALESVQSASVSYPYHSLWTYNPVKSASVPGYLRYLDNGGAGSLVGYNNPQPVYAVRQIKYVSSATPALGASAINNSEEIIKARETYLRAASLQLYQNLKRDIDALRAEGKEPSSEKVLKLERLQKIAFTSDFSLIADLPEIRSTLQELEAGISGLKKDSAQKTLNQEKHFAQTQGEIKTYVGHSNIPLVAIEETPEQKEARENHLRIYNEQIAHLKKLESEHQKYIQEAASKSKISQSKNVDKSNVEEIDNAKALEELERAQQEHFRLWNEAKLKAEQSDGKNRGVYETADKQQISASTNERNIKSKQTSPNYLNPESQKPQSAAGGSLHLDHHQQLTDQGKLRTENVQIAHRTHELQHVVDTPEVANAREEHLRIVNEAILKAQAEQTQSQQQKIKSDAKAENIKVYSDSLSQQFVPSHSQKLKDSTSTNYRAEFPSVEETPEVMKAREEHLRLVHEANLRAQFVEQQALKYKHESQTPILKSQFEHQQLAFHSDKSQSAQKTSEAVKERLQLANEGKLNAYKSEQNRTPLDFQTPAQHQQLSEAQTSGDTYEVQRAREEHLRIFNSIKTHAEQERAKQNSRNFPQASSQLNPILDYPTEEERILELERQREVERLQKEQQSLELDRLREAERLAEEKRQMEAELTRLRLEEEQRLEMERLMEEKRLRQEQEELQKLKNDEYQEIIIENDSVDLQPQISIIPSSNKEEARTQQKLEVVEQQDQKYAKNPFNSQQSSFLKIVPAQIPSNIYQPNSIASNGAVPSIDNTVSGVRYIQSPHQSSGGKYQHVKDDDVKHNHYNAASSQPADTSAALIALEKARNDHFRAHELALEQLRIARIQNPSIKDCN